MEVKIIDNLYVVFNNKKYKKDIRSGYYWSTIVPRTSLHKDVYIFYYGKIPKGYEIHHKDFNKENNSKYNLDCITIKQHKKIHIKNIKEKYGSNWNKENIEKARIGLAEWHKSEDYKKWKKDNKEKLKQCGKSSHASREKVKLKCEICGNLFYGYKKRKRKICSNKCHAQDRRNSNKDKVQQMCVICNKYFTTNKFKMSKTCSKHCGCILAYANRNKNKKNNN